MIIDKNIKITGKGVELIIDKNDLGEYAAKVFKDGVIQYQSMWYETEQEVNRKLDKINRKQGKKYMTTKRERLMGI